MTGLRFSRAIIFIALISICAEARASIPPKVLIAGVPAYDSARDYNKALSEKQLQMSVTDGTTKVIVTSCEDLLRYETKGYFLDQKGVSEGATLGAIQEGDKKFGDQVNRCKAIRWYAHLRGSEKSFVRDLEKPRTLLNVLPLAAVNTQGESSFQRQFKLMVKNGTSVRSFNLNFPQFRIRSNEAQCHLEAFGDWNGDGLEDAVVTCKSIMGSHDTIDSEVVVSRKPGDKLLRVVSLVKSRFNQFSGGSAPSPRPELVTLHADLSCSGDILDDLRDRINTARDLAPANAFSKLDSFRKNCESRLADGQTAWLYSDLMLYAYQSHDSLRCQKLLGAYQKKDLAYASKKAKAAFRHNRALCLKGNLK